MSDRQAARVVRFIVWPGLIGLMVLAFYLQGA